MICEEPWFGLIKEGKKTAEAQIYDRDRQAMSPGDTLIIRNDKEQINCIIKVVMWYPGIREFLQVETLNKVVPGIRNIDEAIKVYTDKWDGELIKRYGIAGIRFGT